MKKSIDPNQPLAPEPPFNGQLTARPKPRRLVTEVLVDDGDSEMMEYGPMNEEDAIESGYTDESGHAVEMAKPDVKGSPTGAWTDIGAGRSSVVKHH